MRTYIPSAAEIAHRLANGGEGEIPVNRAEFHNTVAQQVDLSVSEAIKKVEGERRANRLTTAELRNALDLLYQKHDFHPIEEMILLAKRDNAGNISLDQRITLLKELAQYIAPKLKSVEHTGTVDHNHKIFIQRFGRDGTMTTEPLSVPVPRDSGAPISGIVEERIRKELRPIEAEVVK